MDNQHAHWSFVVQGSLDQPPILLQADRKRGLPLLVLGLVTVGVGAAGIVGPKLTPGGVICFVMGLLFFFAGLLMVAGPTQLVIAPGGIELKGALKTRRFAWDEVAAFRPVRLRGKARLIGFERTWAAARSGLFRDLAMAFNTANVSSPYDAALPGAWGSATAETVAELLNEGRAKWGGATTVRALELRPRGSSGQRIDRRLYWLAIGVLLALGVLVSLATHGSRLSGGLTLLWVWVYTRRLHDIGRSGWWQAGLFATQIALAAVLIVALHAGEPVAFGLACLLQFAFTLALGAIPGDPETNRFGPPPGTPALEAQTEMFR